MKNDLNNLFNQDKSSSSNFEINQESKTVVVSLTSFGRSESDNCKGELEMYTIHLSRIESGHIVKKEELSDDQKSDIKRKTDEIDDIKKKN